MRMRSLIIAFVLLATAGVWAADFLTEGVDIARTGWAKDETIFSTANVGSSTLLWKIKLDSKPRSMHNLFAPLIAEHIATPQGRRELAIVAGVSDDLFGIDAATGQLAWHRHWDGGPENPPPSNDTLCPG